MRRTIARDRTLASVCLHAVQNLQSCLLLIASLESKVNFSPSISLCRVFTGRWLRCFATRLVACLIACLLGYLVASSSVLLVSDCVFLLPPSPSFASVRVSGKFRLCKLPFLIFNWFRLCLIGAVALDSDFFFLESHRWFCLSVSSFFCILAPISGERGSLYPFLCLSRRVPLAGVMVQLVSLRVSII